MEEEKKKRAEFTKRYQQGNHGKQQQRMCGYKKQFMNSNPEPTLKYYVASVVVNGRLNIEDDEQPLNWVKGNSSLSSHVLTIK